MNETWHLFSHSTERQRASGPSSPVLSVCSRSVEEFHSSTRKLHAGIHNEPTLPPSSNDKEDSASPETRQSLSGEGRRILFRSDLIARGETSASIRRKVRSGELIHVARGWYSTEAISGEEFLLELQRILPEDVVFGGETAALFYGVDARGQDRPDEPFRLCMLRPRGRRALRRPGERCRSMTLEDDEIVVVAQGIRITSAIRTLCDLVMSERIDRATALVEEFLRRRLVTVKELWAAIRARRGRRGVKVLRRAVREADPRSESVQETAVRLRLREAGLPLPSTQIEVKRHCGRVFRMDMGWKCGSGGVAVEYYGQSFHPDAGPKAEADAERLEELAEAGWEAIVVRAEDMAGQEPVFEKAVAEALRVRLGRRFRVGMREKWRLTRTNRVRNAWSRRDQLGWTLWEERRHVRRRRHRP